MKYFLAIAALLPALFFNASAIAGSPGEPIWIDVRTQEEFNSGHVEGSHLIPYDTIETGIAAVAAEKDTPIYVYCRSGRRSGIAKQTLEKLGYTSVTNLGSLESAQAKAAQP